MPVEHERREPPAPPASIERLEQWAGSPLPSGYREYLLRQDGGFLAANTEAVSIVYGVGDDIDPAASIWEILDTYAGRLPSWMLPVAGDDFGNLFALSLRPEDHGSVWFWDHDLEDDPPTEAPLTFKSPDWESFMQSLQPLPPTA